MPFLNLCVLLLEALYAQQERKVLWPVGWECLEHLTKKGEEAKKSCHKGLLKRGRDDHTGRGRLVRDKTGAAQNRNQAHKRNRGGHYSGVVGKESGSSEIIKGGLDEVLERSYSRGNGMYIILTATKGATPRTDLLACVERTGESQGHSEEAVTIPRDKRDHHDHLAVKKAFQGDWACTVRTR